MVILNVDRDARFIKLIFGIFRHNPKYRSNKLDVIDKDKWLQNVIWPIVDFTKWLAQLLYVT